eukprot:evm.model.scf_89.12 EVM.evm.TU.scf_89.12   scf_89:56885-57652(-)
MIAAAPMVCRGALGRLLLRPSPRALGGFRAATPHRCHRRIATAMALTAYVKGDPASGTLGDCPFCHRVLLTLEEKSVPHDRQYIAFDAKPTWLLDVNPSGTVPVVKDGDEWVVDSGTIVEYLEKKFPSPSMAAPPEMADIGQDVFGAFRRFLLPGDDDPAQAEAKWLAELKGLDEALTAAGGPFFGGQGFNSIDAMLLPRLYHAFTALRHFKGWELPEGYGAVARYVADAKGRESWKKSDYGEEMIIQGWAPKFA